MVAKKDGSKEIGKRKKERKDKVGRQVAHL